MLEESLHGVFRLSSLDRRRDERRGAARPPGTVRASSTLSASPNAPLTGWAPRHAETRITAPLSAIGQIVSAIRLWRERARSRQGLRDPVKALRSIGVFRTFVPHCVPAVKKVYSAIGRHRFAVMAVGAGFFAISVSSFATDLGTGYSTAIAVPAQAARDGRRPLPTRPIDPPDARPDRSMQHSRTVDQLYEELMRSSGCFLGSNNASIRGGC